MENSNPVILDISSDDEASFGEARRGSGCSVGEDHDLLSELLDKVDRGSDDSDDVVLVDEVVVKPKKARLNSSKKTVNYNCGDDDDCVILDGDPDKPLAVKNSEADDEDSDDLLVVGEKGQVACRDYPHPRHLCVTFPFASTSHNTHCDRCHCYVCDSLAPCVHWGSGISSIDHCHATDKEEFWKTQRKGMKESDKTKPILNVFPRGNLVPPLHPVQANSSANNQDFNRVKVRPRTPFDIPNIMRSQPSRPAVLRYRCQPRMVPQPLRSTQDRTILSKNSRHVGARGPQIIPPCTSFEGRGLARVDSVNDRRGCGLPKNSYGSQFPSTPPPPRWYASHGEAHPGVSDYANYAPPELQMSSRACRLNSLKTVTSQPQIASQPFIRNNLQNTTIPQRPLVSQPNRDNTFHPLPSQSHASTPLYRQSSSEHPVSPTSSRPNMESTYECFLSPQPQVYSAPTSSTDGQNIFQQEKQMQSDLGTSCMDFGFSWDPSASGSNQQVPAGSSQLQNPVPADNFPYQSIAQEENSQFLSVPPEDNSYGHVAVPAAENFSLVEDNNSKFPGSTDPNLLGFQFDWMFENPYVPGALEVSVPPGLNIYSPEPGTIDAGTLFDF